MLCKYVWHIKAFSGEKIVDNMNDQIGSFSRERKGMRKNQMEMLELKKTQSQRWDEESVDDTDKEKNQRTWSQ